MFEFFRKRAFGHRVIARLAEIGFSYDMLPAPNSMVVICHTLYSNGYDVHRAAYLIAKCLRGDDDAIKRLRRELGPILAAIVLGS